MLGGPLTDSPLENTADCPGTVSGVLLVEPFTGGLVPETATAGPVTEMIAFGEVGTLPIMLNGADLITSSGGPDG